MTFLEAQWPDAASPPGALHLEPEPGRTLGLAVGLWAATCLEFQLSHLSCRSVGERLLTLSLKFLEMMCVRAGGVVETS